MQPNVKIKKIFHDSNNNSNNKHFILLNKHI